MNNKKIIIIAAAVLVVGVILYALFGNKNTGGGLSVTEVQAPTEAAFDVAMEFYNQWLSDTQSTTTDPIASGLINSPVLSDELRTMIQDKRTARVDGDLEPVLCQATIPERVGGREVFALNTEAQVAVLARGFEVPSPYQALVTLTAVDGKWQISSINCTQGEVAPVREYDFERSGFLLKASVPPPLNPEYWHLVYEEVGKPGHTLPLFFDAESICILGGVEAVCDPSQFMEASKVLLQADMLEAGADVRRVTFE